MAGIEPSADSDYQPTSCECDKDARPAPRAGLGCFRIIAIVAGVFFCLFLVAAVYFFLTISAGINDAYALWGAADMVIDYMETHDGHWPRSWDDLRPQFEAGGSGVGGWSFEKYQDRITIDFNADPNELRRLSLDSPEASFRVIWANSLNARLGSETHIGDGPNQMLCDYFRVKAGLEPYQSKESGDAPTTIPRVVPSE